MSNVVEEEPLEDENSIKEGSYFSINKKQEHSGSFTEEIVKESISHNGTIKNYRSNNMGLGLINTGIMQSIQNIQLIQGRPKSGASKYSAVVFTVPIDKPKNDNDKSDDNYEDDFEDDFEPYETSNDDFDKNTDSKKTANNQPNVITIE